MIKKLAFGCFAMDFRPAKVLQKSDYANRWRLYFSFLSVIFFLLKTKTIQKKLYSLQLYAVFYYLCIRNPALGNLKASFHCARLRYLCTQLSQVSSTRPEPTVTGA